MTQKFRCDKNHIFIYPSVITEHNAKGIQTFPDKTDPIASTTVIDWLETTLHACPFCKSPNLTEYQEPQPEIVSVKSVDLAEVDTYLKEGYIVESLYAKNAVLLKREVPKLPGNVEVLQDANSPRTGCE